MFMATRARSVVHVEYELIHFIGQNIHLDDLMEQMIPEGDDVAAKRFKTGATNITKYLMNMAERRKHRLPEQHPDYRGKDN
tara:strand:- start:112 stop:354 length:243 start_codon:yes stop_codon:yes gene_type:complete